MDALPSRFPVEGLHALDGELDQPWPSLPEATCPWPDRIGLATRSSNGAHSAIARSTTRATRSAAREIVAGPPLTCSARFIGASVTGTVTTPMADITA